MLGLAIVGIIGGVGLGVWVIWPSVVRTCKLRTHVTSDRTSESTPLLNQDRADHQRSGLIEGGEQRDPTVTLGSDTLLCSICANLDFHQIFLDGIPKAKEIPLGSLSSILEKSYQCNFCRLISFHVRRTWMWDKLPHVDPSGIACGLFSISCGSLRPSFYPRSKFRCYRLQVTIGSPMGLWWRHPALNTAYPPTIHLMQDDAFKFGRPTDLHGRRVKNTVDISLVKKWMKLCQENHGDGCENAWKMDKKLPGFYWTMKDNIAERSKPGGLNAANLPDTITDSILFVRQLGERYIWIDALCIIQDDLHDKFTQIHAMDSVYGLSYLTIIAAGSTTARDPLPGCRPRTRTVQQHIEVVQGLHLYVAPPRPTDVLALSAWNTRCWTYQESALSRRRIYFTAQQVYFECQNDIFCEDIIAESKRPQLSRSFLQSSFGDRFPDLSSFSGYKGAVERYTRRNLTVESDIVDAFTGVTNALAIRYGLGDPASAFQYGMMLTELHLALLWQHHPHTPHIRRAPPDGGISPWPSWAWAAWRGAVIHVSEGGYQGTRIRNLGDDLSVTKTLIDPWYMVDRRGDITQLNVRRVSRVFFVNRRTEEENPAYSSPQGIIDLTELTHRPLETGTLIFRTTSSHFGIARRSGEETQESNEPVHYGHFNILCTTSSPPSWVGTTILPLDPAPPPSLEFIVLSRTYDTGGVHNEENLMVRDEYLLHVMAVSQNEGLMERVGLGVIHEAAWITSRPEEKVVFLR
ncbi:heterokaryon incompatibility protein-domain-containing protein [Suillus paluster]|uniref:heterokaryon incompatibility protein-domain-containing protein n=1 Tax=Suillus paluster TaxID=48578 RepID=UPI001B85DB48|nr:heterokaryon incompatibility protein-domain-containing protein [Suillus paluster]KAG1742780.1 heterokaryon incompatibility protein-domain-containing protein [Suillus paluster]